VNRVEALGNAQVALIRERSRECGGSGVGHGVSIVGKTGDGSTILNVRDDRVPVATPLPEGHVAKLGKPLDLITDVDIALGCDLGLQTEDKRGIRCQGFGLVVQLEPLL